MPHYRDDQLFKVVHSSGESVKRSIRGLRFVGGEIPYPVSGSLVNQLKTSARLHVFPYDITRQIVWRKPPGATRNRPFYELKKQKPVEDPKPVEPQKRRGRGRGRGK